MMAIEYILDKLQKSKFRNSFRLKQKDFSYIKRIAIDKIKLHAIDFVKNRLSDITLVNDGKQTPMKGHPVFIAQHATATCCRECLYKWHKIEQTHILNDTEISYIVSVIMTWILKEIKENQNGQK